MNIALTSYQTRLISFEREAWVETVLKQGRDANLEEYLNQRLNENV